MCLRSWINTFRPLANSLILGVNSSMHLRFFFFNWEASLGRSYGTCSWKQLSVVFHHLPQNNLQKSPHQFQVTLDNCLEETHMWKKNIQMETTWMINPLTPLHGGLNFKQLSWLLKLGSFTQGFSLATSPFLPVRYWGDRDTDSVTSGTPTATDWCKSEII